MTDRPASIEMGIKKGRQVVEDGLLPGKDPFAVLAVFVFERVPDATHDEIVEGIGALMRQSIEDDDSEAKEFWISIFERTNH
jgi:hypothetical protein